MFHVAGMYAIPDAIDEDLHPLLETTNVSLPTINTVLATCRVLKHKTQPNVVITVQNSLKSRVTSES